MHSIKIWILMIPYFRKIFYRKRFNLNKNVVINNCFINSKKGNTIKCEDGVIIGESIETGESPIRIVIKHSGVMLMKSKSFLRGGCKIFISGNGYFELGAGSYLNFNSVVSTGGKAKVLIGNKCSIAWNVNLLAYDFHKFNNSNYYGDIIIEDNVWIGASSTILKNSTIRQGCVVAANSVIVGGDYPPNSLIGGNPAKIIKSNINWRDLSPLEKSGL